MSKVTLKMIAKTLDMSTATVSKALKDYPDINIKTKQRVLDLAKSLNYKPNSFAQNLRNKESKMVGLIVPDIINYFFSNIIKGVIDSAEKVGYLVIVLQSNESYENEKKQIELLGDKNVDGILLSLSDKTVRYDHIKNVMKQGIPIVLYDKISKLIDCSKIIIDDKKAAFNATEYLIKTGCKKIAHVRGPLKPQTTIDRFNGYKNALNAYGIPFENSLVYNSENLSYEDGYDLASEMLKDHPDLDGVFAFTDLVAIGVLTKLKELEVKIPEQVSVIGFSNWFMTKITSPTLSTIDQPGYEIGVKAFNILYQEINDIKQGKPFFYKVEEVETKVIIRNSTKVIR